MAGIFNRFKVAKKAPSINVARESALGALVLATSVVVLQVAPAVAWSSRKADRLSKNIDNGGGSRGSWGVFGKAFGWNKVLRMCTPPGDPPIVRGASITGDANKDMSTLIYMSLAGTAKLFFIGMVAVCSLWWFYTAGLKGLACWRRIQASRREKREALRKVIFTLQLEAALEKKLYSVSEDLQAEREMRQAKRQMERIARQRRDRGAEEGKDNNNKRGGREVSDTAGSNLRRPRLETKENLRAPIVMS